MRRTERSSAASRMSSDERLGRRRVEMRGRLVEHEHRRVREERAGERRAAGADRRTAAFPPRRRACRARREATRPSRRAARGASASASSASVAAGRARRRFSRIVESKTCASWPASANIRRTSSCRYSRRSWPAIVTRPRSGSRKRRSRFVDRRLPGAARPDERDPPARARAAGRSPETTGSLGRRVARGHALERDRAPVRAEPRPGLAGSRTAGSRSVSSSTRRPGGERRRELARGGRERRDRLERREREQGERRDEHAVERRRRRAPRRRRRARPRRSARRRGSRERPRARRRARRGGARRASSRVGRADARERSRPRARRRRARARRRRSSTSSAVSSPRAAACGARRPARAPPRERERRRRRRGARAARTSPAAGRRTAVATTHGDRDRRARDERRPEPAQVEALERVDVADHAAEEVAAPVALELGRRERLDPLVEAARGSVRARARRGRATRAGRGSARAAGRARRSARRRSSRSARGSAGARRRARSGSPRSSSARCRTPTASAPSTTESATRRAGIPASATAGAGSRSRRSRRSADDPARLEPHDAVGPAGELGPVGDEQHRPARRRSRSTASATIAALAGSRLAVGSSRTTSGASRRNARASAIRCRCPAESGRPPSPTTVSYPSGSSRDEAVGAGEPRGGVARAPSAAVGSPSRMLSATVPRKSVGCCGTHASCERHAAASQSARSTPPTVTRPAVGSPRRRRSEATVLLPPPLGPTSATVSPGGELEVDADSSTAPAARRVRERDALEPDRRVARARRRDPRRPATARRPLDQLEQPLRRPRARRRSRGTARARLRSGRYSSGASTSTVSAVSKPMRAVDEAHADGHGDERDAERRRELEHRPGEERDAQRPHRRPAVLRRSPPRSARSAPRRG